jgi:hypothetical protein
MTSLMKCAPARSTVASFWKLREQTAGIIGPRNKGEDDES